MMLRWKKMKSKELSVIEEMDITIKKKKITPIRLRLGRKISAANIAASVSFAIPKQSWGTMRISIMTGGKRCKFSGTSVKAVRRGTCSVAVVLLPKNGKASIRNNTITIS